MVLFSSLCTMLDEAGIMLRGMWILQTIGSDMLDVFGMLQQSLQCVQYGCFLLCRITLDWSSFGKKKKALYCQFFFFF